MENLHKKPAKGILKSSSSFEQQSECPTQPKEEHSTDKDIKWDEMNILQTLHPVDKDYGHMKIEEPKTPYNYYSDNTDGDHESHGLDANSLAEKIAQKAMELPKALTSSSVEEQESDESDDENLTEEEKKKKTEFEIKRKMHYNEFQAVKLARKLLEEEEEEEEIEQTGGQTQSTENVVTEEGSSDSKLNPDPNDEVFETSGAEQIDCEDIDSVQNR